MGARPGPHTEQALQVEPARRATGRTKGSCVRALAPIDNPDPATLPARGTPAVDQHLARPPPDRIFASGAITLSGVTFPLDLIGRTAPHAALSEGLLMTLSRIAAEFAAEIRNHDWSDAPYRRDRAGHDRSNDSRRAADVKQLDAAETAAVRTNVVWVTAQVLLHADPNLNVLEFAEACGVERSFLYRSDGKPSGGLMAGIRQVDGQIARPGSWDVG